MTKGLSVGIQAPGKNHIDGKTADIALVMMVAMGKIMDVFDESIPSDLGYEMIRDVVLEMRKKVVSIRKDETYDATDWPCDSKGDQG